MSTRRSLVLVWGPLSHGPRSKVLARELGFDVEFIEATMRRGLLVAPYKYFVQAVATVRLLARRRPRFVVVQSPPSIAVMVVAAYGALTNSAFVIDAHSDALLSPWWTRPRWLHRRLARRALATIVTNEHFVEKLTSVGATALLLRDIPTSFPTAPPPELGEGFHVMVVNTFAADEPLTEILDAARLVPEATFHVTGRVDRNEHKLPDRIAANVRFTGFVPDDDYFALMGKCNVVMCLTTRNHTMQRGACEALSVGRPIITSDWPLLRDYFARGTIHVDNTAPSIAAAVRRMSEEETAHVDDIRSLQASQHLQWDTARRQLLALLESSDGTARRTRARGAA